MIFVDSLAIPTSPNIVNVFSLVSLLFVKCKWWIHMPSAHIHRH